MKRSRQVTLLCLTTIVAGFMVGCPAKPNHLRQRHNPDGSLMYDTDGNPIYEDDDRQHYTYYGGHYYPWYTRGNGYSSIPGSGISAPDVSGGVSSESVASRGGFGAAGEAHGGGVGAEGGAHGGGFGGGE
jgi:hypothetical protein